MATVARHPCINRSLVSVFINVFLIFILLLLMYPWLYMHSLELAQT